MCTESGISALTSFGDPVIWVHTIYSAFGYPWRDYGQFTVLADGSGRGAIAAKNRRHGAVYSTFGQTGLG